MPARPLTRSLAAAAVLGMLGGACATAEAPGAVMMAPPGNSAAALSPAPLPAPLPPSQPTVAATVELHEPDLVVRPEVDDETALWSALGVAEVSTVAAGREVRANIVTVDADRAVTVLSVDPHAFRPLTPDVTANEASVWERLIDGDVLVRHDVAHDLGLTLGGTILLVSETGTEEVRIGAFASNGAPPVADIIAPWDLAARLGDRAIDMLLIAVADGHDVDDVGSSVLDAIGGGEVTVRRGPSSQQARLRSGGRVQIEPFTYTSIGDGTIRIHGDWVSRWIVRVDLPRVGLTHVNRVMAPQLLGAMRELDQRGLLDQFDPSQFGGGWVARHIDWNPRKPLSMHAWGLAVDFNTRNNPLGHAPVMDGRIVDVFQRWGFNWGGHWSRPDGMHFELARIVEAD